MVSGEMLGFAGEGQPSPIYHIRWGKIVSKILRDGIYIFMGVLIIGCTTLPAKIQNIKQDIIGTNIDTLFSNWGVPSLSSPLPSGKGVVHVWASGGCKSNVSTDENGTITNYAVSGNCAFIQ